MFKPETKKIVSEFAEKTFQEMVEFVRKEFNSPKFEPILKVCFSTRRTASWGGLNKQGKPFVSLAAWTAANACQTSAKMGFYEYASIARSPLIGTIPETTWRGWIAALVAHEIAHAFQFYAVSSSGKSALSMFPSSVLKDRQGHGKLWQHIYGKIRFSLVNGKDFGAIPSVWNNPQRQVKPLQTQKTRAPKPGKIEINAFAYKGGRVSIYSIDGREIGRLFNRTGYMVQRKLPGLPWEITSFIRTVDAKKDLFLEAGV